MDEKLTVNITLREVYDTQVEMLTSLNKIATAVERIPDHESRIRSLEDRIRLWAGGLAAVALVVTPLLSVFSVRTWG